MNVDSLLRLASFGEDSTHQFKADVRNVESLLVSYVAKGLLPYHGLGSGIKRALNAWHRIDFTDDHEGCLFTATVHRKPVGELKLADKDALKVQIKMHDDPGDASLSEFQRQLLGHIRLNPAVSYDDLVALTGKNRSTVMRNVQKLKQQNRLHRVGSRKTGRWTVIQGEE